MSAGTIPIQTCDHEDGCDEWTIDYYELTASNWRELTPGWVFERPSDKALCPTHAAEQFFGEDIEACDDCERDGTTICADGDRLHCDDCAQSCKACQRDQDEQRQVDAARKGE